MHCVIYFVYQGQALCISSAKWIWVTQQLHCITLAGFSVTACISVSLQDEIIKVPSQVIIFLKILSLLKPNFYAPRAFTWKDLNRMSSHSSHSTVTLSLLFTSFCTAECPVSGWKSVSDHQFINYKRSPWAQNEYGVQIYSQINRDESRLKASKAEDWGYAAHLCMHTPQHMNKWWNKYVLHHHNNGG